MNDNSDPFEIHKACRGRLVATQFATTLTIAVCLVLTNSGLMVGQDAAKTAVQTDSDLPAVVSKYSKGAIKKWESDIVKLEAKDRSEQHPDDSILFIAAAASDVGIRLPTTLLPTTLLIEGTEEHATPILPITQSD